MSGDLWMTEYEGVFYDLDDEKIDRAEAETRLKRLGLDPSEIAETLEMHISGVGL